MRVGSLRNAGKRGLKSSVNRLKGWKKGLFIGFFIGLILGILSFIGEAISSWKYVINDPFSQYIVPIFIIFILPATLIGIYIGFLTSIKDKYIKKWGIVGGVFGIIVTLISFSSLTVFIKLFSFPTVFLLRLISNCQYWDDCYGYFLFLSLPLNFVFYNLIGILIGFFISKIRRGKNG